MCAFATPPYTFAWNNVAAGSYSLTANPIVLTVDAGIDGAQVNDDRLLVSGTFNAPPNTGVTVNGVLSATLQEGFGYRYYANNVPLDTGSNTVNIDLVSQDGQTERRTVTVSSTGATGYSIYAQETD